MTRTLAWMTALLCAAGGPETSAAARESEPCESTRAEDDGADEDQNLDDLDPFSVRLQQDPVFRSQLKAGVMVERGLMHLSERLRQGRDGGLPSVSGKDPIVAKMALTALAFMANGNTTEHSPFSIELRQCLRWLVSRVKEVPSRSSISPPPTVLYFFDARDNLSRMHGHGYATWALALSFGMAMGGDSNSRDRFEIKRVLAGAVRCIEQSQTESGGWGYEYERGTFHEGSMTVTQLQALRSARDAGIHVDEEVIDSAVRYLRDSKIREGPRQGAYRYKLGDLNTSFALTAAAVSSLNQTGVYDDSDIDDGMEYMRQSDPLMNAKNEKFPWYSRLYATQAYWQYRELEPFRRFYPILVERISNAADPRDGAFNDGSEYGSDYSTALGVIALSVPFGYLPSFQR